MPVHHSGDFKYPTPSPSSPPACERNKPFFLKTKLEPIKRPLATASIIPTIFKLEPTEKELEAAEVDAEADAEVVDDKDDDMPYRGSWSWSWLRWSALVSVGDGGDHQR